MRDARPWRYDLFPLSGDDEALAPFRDVLAVWRGAARGRDLPCWRDIDITKFAGWLDMMTLDEVRHDPIDALSLIWGSRLADICGYQPRGTWLRAAPEMRGLIDEDLAFWERLCSEPAIGLTRGTLDWRRREHIVIERLYLPCAPEGRPVDRVVTFSRALHDDRHT